MKVRDETLFKPKLSHPKETRNREREKQGWLILSTKREKTEVFRRFMWKREARCDGALENSTCWVESFLKIQAVLQTEDQGWSSCVSKHPASWIVPDKRCPISVTILEVLLHHWFPGEGAEVYRNQCFSKLEDNSSLLHMFYAAHIIYPAIIFYNTWHCAFFNGITVIFQDNNICS